MINSIFAKVPVSRIMAAGLLSSVLLLPITARAEVKGGSVEVTPFAGFNFFENGQNVKDRFIYGGRIGYNLTPHWGIEGSVDFINTHVDDKSKTVTRKGGSEVPRIMWI